MSENWRLNDLRFREYRKRLASDLIASARYPSSLISSVAFDFMWRWNTAPAIEAYRTAADAT